MVDRSVVHGAASCMVAKEAGWQYARTMTAITEQLEATLKRLDDRAAASLVRLVRDALELASVQKAAHPSDRLPADFFTRIARELGPEPFDRPPQGTLEKREAG